MELYLKNQLQIALIIYTGQMMVGFGLGWSAPIIPILQDTEHTPLPSIISGQQASWIGSALYIGTIIGPYVSGYLSNIQGRTPCLILGGILTLFSFILLAMSSNLAMILAGRIFTGLGTGIIFVTNLVYIGEIASTNIRGILLTGTGVFSTVGTLVVFSVAPYVPYWASSVVGLAITAGYVVGLMFIPESPMFFIIKEREEDAINVLKMLGREDDIGMLLSVKQTESDQNSDWKDLFTIKSNRRAFIITFVLGILQQLSGIIVVVFFATTIFDMADSSIEPNTATIIIGVTQIVSSCIAPFFVERSGRKILLLASTGCCCISLAVLGTYFLLDHYNHSVVAKVQWLPLVILMVFFLSYDMGFGIIPGTFIGEMFQSNIRSIGSAVTVTSAWLFGFGVASAFDLLISFLGGHGTFWMFAGACGLAFVFTAIFVPETRGKSLLEIQEMLSK
ncbi:facilitated trehalose transporter Tret1-like [Pectinophora gossypiella]|uniref:facilitated trehalose transporter Tret1-like n=1 Tax=Pectinophora gossypiella TaxID=13191 RepID=UPI00214EE739|nr:facilitated trehalose transporter Tret1-like [Pectinophora gossypiella]